MVIDLVSSYFKFRPKMLVRTNQLPMPDKNAHTKGVSIRRDNANPANTKVAHNIKNI